MKAGFKNTISSAYRKGGKRSLGIIVVSVVAALLIISAVIALPYLAENVPHEKREVVAIVPNDNAMIGVNADVANVFVTIKYSDNTEEVKSLAELLVTGLEISEPGTLTNVVLNFGGFVQKVEYQVLPTEIRLRYTASNGGRIEGVSDQKVVAGLNGSTVRAIPDEGYRFDYWNDGVLSAERRDMQVSSDKDVRAVFVRKIYTVVFEYADGTIGRERLISHGGSAASYQHLPTERGMQKYGYKFIGWDISSEQLNNITSDMVIKPIYEKYATDVVLEHTLGIEGTPLGTGIDIMDYYPKTEEAIIRVKANPERTFTGWSVQNYLGEWLNLDTEGSSALIEIGEANNAVPFSSSRTGASDEYVLTFTPTAYTDDIRIKANYIYNNSIITFTSMSTAAHATIEIPKGVSLGAYFNASDQDALFDAIDLDEILGYSFKGWYVRNGAVDANGLPVLIKNSHSFDQPADLIAYWEKEQYEVIFYRGDSENMSADISVWVYYQDSLAGEGDTLFPSVIPERANYTFTGWYLGERGSDADIISDRAIDKTYKIEKKLTEIFPVFKVNQKNLSVSVEGSGSLKVREEGNAPETGVGITGIYKLDVIKDYAIDFNADEGYSLLAIEVTKGGNTERHELPGVLSYTMTIGINEIINDDYHIKAIFRLSEYDLIVRNGTSSSIDSGTISYQVLVEQELITEVKNDVTIFSKVNDSISKHIWIQARTGYYIASIKVNDVPISALPTRTTAYTLVLENISRRVDVEISYGQFEYIAQIYNHTTGYGAVTAKTQQPYTVTDEPMFEIQASEGYYIKFIRINGTAVDPYSPSTNYRIDNVMLMGRGVQSGAPYNDERVTSYLLTVRRLSGDLEIEAEFARLYYNVTISTHGFGEAYTMINNLPSETATVNYGSSIAFSASTTANYYVSGYVVNDGLPVAYTEHNTEQIITLEGVREDKNITVEFKRKSFSLTFTGANTVLEYTEDDIVTSSELPKSLVREAASNEYFVVRATDGYKLTSVEVNGVAEDIAFDASFHNITIDNVSGDYTIVVTTESLTYSVKYYFANQGDSMAYSDSDYVQYNETYKLTIDLANGKTLDKDDIIILGVVSRLPVKDTGMFYMEVNQTTVFNQYELSIVGFYEDIEIFIPILDILGEPDGKSIYDINLTHDASMGRLYVSGTSETSPVDPEHFLRVPHGANATLRFEPLSDEFILKYLVINGKKTEYTGNEYILTNIEADVSVHAVFDRRLFNISVSYNANGIVTVSEAVFNYGANDIIIRLAAAIGYEVTSFEIGASGATPVPRGNDELARINAGQVDYVIPATETISDLQVFVMFTPRKYELMISTNDGGTVDNEIEREIIVEYGEFFRLYVEANDNHFIEAISVNGASIDPATLSNPTMNREIQKYISGTLSREIIGATRIVVTFSPNIYRTTIAETAGGTTLVGTDTEVMSNGKALRLHAGETVVIRMTAASGYHIETLKINNVLIENWHIDPTQPNNNRTVDYAVHNVSSNLNIEVSYAINRYEISYSISNGSVNFSRYDDIPTKYGTFSIYGRLPEGDGYYADIEHGSDLRFIFSPIRSKGYYVSAFIITWVSPDNKESNQVTRIDATAEAARTSQYIHANIRGNLTIQLEFKRELFSFTSGTVSEQMGAPFASTGSLDYVFSNPYAGSGSTVQLVDGEYEYGLTYTMVVNPGTGYTLTSFTVNGIDRISSVRSSRFNGEIRTDIDIVATYTIIRQEVTFNGNFGGLIGIYSEAGATLWEKDGINTPRTEITTTGRVDIFANYILATYGTRLVFRTTPMNEANGYENGYIISSFYVNNSYQTVTTPKATFNYYGEVTTKLNVDVSFALEQYQISFDYNEYGGVTQASPVTVIWGNSTVISLTVYSGYLLTGLRINGNSNSEIFNAIRNKEYAEFTLSNIKQNTQITFLYERRPYSVTFLGGYDEVFAINGTEHTSSTGVVVNEASQTPSKHFSSIRANAPITAGANIIDESGVVTGGGVAGARYNDRLTLYFLPVNGYRIATIRITMKDAAQNDVLMLSRPQDLVIIDTVNGYSTFTILNVTGDVTVTVTYTIKTYTVSMNIIGNGAADNTHYNFVSHHDDIVLNYIANYGYSLQSLIINDRTVVTDNRKELHEGNLVYKYSTSYGANILNINDQLVNGKTEIVINATFVRNTFAVKMFVNGRDISSSNPDPTLSLILPNNNITFLQNAGITQNRAEGYSITSITFQNKETNPDYTIDFSSSGVTNNLTASTLFFTVTGAVIDMLDYHSSTNKTLYIKYTTKINEHYSTVNSHTYETGVDYGAVPLMGGVPVFTLETSYEGNMSDDGTKYEYFTRARFTVSISSQANRDYQFAGYQEKKNGEWVYVQNGVDGITLGSEGRVLNYQIRGDREFRAVIFRMYEVVVQVHPEYKYMSGSYTEDRFDMRYRRYASITAMASYSADQRPNITSNMVVLTDTDGNDSNASYTYRVHCGATLILSGADRQTTYNQSQTTTYYYINYNHTGIMQKTAVDLVRGDAIVGDREVHAYFDNRLYVSFSLESVGGIGSNEGGSVKYFVGGNSRNLSNNSLQTIANATVRVEIEPSDNYRFDAVLMKEALDEVDESGNRIFTENWLNVASSGDGSVVVETITDNTGRVTKVILTVVVTENTIYKIKFWKLIEVNANVQMFVDETTNPDLINRYTPQFVEASENRLYDYGETVTYTLPAVSETNTWNIRSQFVGFFINGVNTYDRLAGSFPTSYTATYRLTEDPTVSNGVTIEQSDGKYKVNIIAMYIPVYNITFENEYYFEEQGKYFDVGQIVNRAMGYTMSKAQYYQTAISLFSKNPAISGSEETYKNIQVMGRLNTLSTIRNIPSAPYNIWNDNTITLNWSSNLSGYTFLAWQYYTYHEGEWKWMNIPYVDTSNPTNRVNFRTFTFPIKALFETSYFNSSQSTQDGYLYPTSPEDPEGALMIRIRPHFQKVETVGIDKHVDYEGRGQHDPSHAGDNLARIQETGGESGQFNYYQIIHLDPATKTGYEFIGWYDNKGVKIERTDPLDINNHARLTGVTGQTLQVRVVDTLNYQARYIKVWDITIRVVNISGTTSHLENSTPFISYYGAGVGSGTEPISDNSRLISASIRAGGIIKFGLKASGTLYDTEFEEYVQTVTINADNTESLITLGHPQGSAVEQLESASYEIVANAAKTIEIRFKTKGKLTIQNVYYGSTIKVPTALGLAANLSNSLIVDGMDDDKLQNGVIVIADIPILSKAYGVPGGLYDGVFSNSLPGMTGGNFITATGINSYGIDFDGNAISAQTGKNGKHQTFKFYNTTYGSNDGLSGLDVPFADGLNINAGNGSIEKPYRIENLAQVRFINNLYVGNGNTVAGLNFKQITNIILGEFTPLCQDGVGFNGNYDGNGYELSGLRITGSLDYRGIFAKTNGATISNINIGGTNVNITGVNYVGYLVGHATRTTISNINQIATDSNIKQVSGTNYVGGIAGKLEDSKILNTSISRFTVSGQFGVGGIVGSIGSNAQVANSSITVVVVAPRGSGASALGGLAGITEGAGGLVAVENSFASPSSFANSSMPKYVGGLVGKNSSGKIIQDSYVIGSFTLNTYYASGFFTALAGDAEANYGGGGLVGYNEGHIQNSGLSGTGTLTFSGTILGGVVGVNKGTIDGGYLGKTVSGNIQNHSIRSDLSAYKGGMFGVLVGVNVGGTISNSVVTAVRNTGWNTTATYYVAVNGTNDFGTGGDPSGRNADSSYIYLGGIVGYNTGGTVMNNSFSGTIKANRSMHHNTSNNLYIGGIAGYNFTASSLISNNVTVASIMAHYNIRTAQNQGGAIHYAYFGATAGNNAYATRGTVNNTNMDLQVVGSGGSGERKARGKNKYLGYYNSHASEYGYVKFRVTWADTSGTTTSYAKHTSRSIPGSLYSTKDWATGKKDYTGTLRQVVDA